MLAAHASALGNDRRIAVHGGGKSRFGAFFNAGVGAFDAGFGVYVVPVGKIAGKVRRLEIHRFAEIIGLQRFGKIVRHFGSAVRRDVFEPQHTGADHRKITCFGVVVVSVAPGAYFCRLIANIGVRLRIEKPERDVKSFYFVDMVLVFEHLRQQPLAREVVCKRLLCVFFVKLERNNVIRF